MDLETARGASLALWSSWPSFLTLRSLELPQGIYFSGDGDKLEPHVEAKNACHISMAGPQGPHKALKGLIRTLRGL